MRVEFSFIADDRPSKIIKQFNAFSRDIADASDLWPEIIRDFKRREEIHFESEGDGQWARLTDGYAAWKQAHGGGGMPILQFGYKGSEGLKDSLTNPARFVQEIGPTKLHLGTDVSYAPYHQNGWTQRGGSRIVNKEISPRQTSQLRRRKENAAAFKEEFNKQLQDRLRREEAAYLRRGKTPPPDLINRIFKAMLAEGKDQLLFKEMEPAKYRRERVSTGGGASVRARPPLISNRAAYSVAWRRLAERWVRRELDEAGL